MAILNKYKHPKQIAKLTSDKYWDFVLSQDNSLGVPLNAKLNTECLISYIDLSNNKCVDYDSGNVISLSNYIYDDCLTSDDTLYDIGFTGIDNGFIQYKKDRISNKEFIDILTESKYKIENGNCRLKLIPVSGNTMLYSYDYDIVKDENDNSLYYSLKGGFLQGFYKLFSFDYSVLPQYIADEWNIEIVIRPRDYEEKENTLNNTHSGTSGFFFYIGTRAENKFAELYGNDFSEYEKRIIPSGLTPISGECEDSEYFADIETEEEEDDFYQTDVMFDENTFVTSDGNSVSDDDKEYDIITDNKFVTFDRTKNGYTTNHYEDTETFTGKHHDYEKDNLFLLVNRTKTGYTVGNIEDYVYEGSDSGDTYDILKDIKGNAFGLKYNKDGSISYRYIVKDCDSKNGWSVKEETSFPNLVKEDEWNIINTKFKIVNGSVDDCGVPYGERKMKIYIYVNGYLKLVSKELPEFDFKELNDNYMKQEGVPFNISIGGGTQGLCDSVPFDYRKYFEYILPLERYFAGTFIGDIRSFKFYNCSKQYNNIKNNYLYEINL